MDRVGAGGTTTNTCDNDQEITWLKLCFRVSGGMIELPVYNHLDPLLDITTEALYRARHK